MPVEPSEVAAKDRSRSELPVAGTDRRDVIATNSDDKLGSKLTADDILKDHWGEEWTDIRAEAVAAGVQLDRVVDPPLAWDEVSLEIEKVFLLNGEDRESLLESNMGGIPDPLTAEWVMSTFSPEDLTIDVVTLADIQDIVSRHANATSDAFEDYYSELKFSVRELWDTKRFLRSPIFAPPTDPVPMFRVSSFTYKGWCVSYVVRSEDFPKLAPLSHQLRLSVFKRDQAIREYLGGL